MRATNIIWWCIFFPLALFVQSIIPGLDALVLGIIILLQERAFKELGIILPIIVLLQEGMGSREFGGAIFWYTIVIAFFFIGYWLFEVQNIVFIFLLSACLGVGHVAIVGLMAPLQDLPIDMPVVIDQGIIQALFIPPAWGITFLMRKMVKTNEA